MPSTVSERGAVAEVRDPRAHEVEDVAVDRELLVQRAHRRDRAVVDVGHQARSARRSASSGVGSARSKNPGGNTGVARLRPGCHVRARYRAADCAPMPQYFDEQPDVRHPTRARSSCRSRGRTLTLATDAGVFSRRRVDPGTDGAAAQGSAAADDRHHARPRVRVRADRVRAGRAVARRRRVGGRRERARPRAHRAQRGRARARQRARVAAPDDVPPDVAFDAIFSNPPVRIGKDAMHELLDRWLRAPAPARSRRARHRADGRARVPGGPAPSRRRLAAAVAPAGGLPHASGWRRARATACWSWPG